MRKGHTQAEFIFLGAIFAIFFLAISHKMASLKLLSRVHIEDNSYQYCFMPVKPILKPNKPAFTDDDELLITTEYYSYYIPANLSGMIKHFGHCYTETKLLNAIFQIENQIKAHKITYNNAKLNNFNESLNNYIKEQKIQDCKCAKIKLDQSLYALMENMNSLNSPVAKEGVGLINRITGLIIKTKPESMQS